MLRRLIALLLTLIMCGVISVVPSFAADYWIQDCSAATENILLRVTDLGLGAVWCGIHPQKRAEEKVRECLGLDKNEIPLNIILVGHPAEEPEARDQYEAKRVHYIE